MMMKIIIGIFFGLFVLSLIIGLSGDSRLLLPSSVFGGSALIALAITTNREGK